MFIAHIKTFALTLFISVIVFFTIIFYVIENNARVNETSMHINRNYEVILNCREIQLQLFQVENEAKAYLSKIQDHISNPEQKFDKVDSSLKTLIKRMSDHSMDVSHVIVLKSLLGQRQSELKKAFAERADTNTESLADTELPKRMYDQFAIIEKIERQRLDQTNASLKASQKNVFIFNFLGGICALFMATVAVIKLLQHIKQLNIAQVELEHKEEKLRIIYNSTSDALMVLDINSFTIVDCNNTTLSLFNEQNKESFIGKDFFAFGNQSSKAEEKNSVGELLKQSKSWTKEVVFKTKNDLTFWGEVCFSRTHVDDKESVLVRITDITKRKNAEREVEETSKILNGILDNLPVMVYKLDSIGTIRSLRGSGLEAVGLDREKLIGGNVYKYFPNMEQGMENAYHWNSAVFTANQESDSKEYFLEHYLFKDPDDEGGLIGFALDITMNKEGEKELIQAKQNAERAARARQKFLSTMSHEIRTPLNAIIGMTHLLLQDKLSEQQFKRLNILKFSGENLLNTLNDILDFSKIESGGVDFAKSDFHLLNLVRNTHESFLNLADKKGITLLSQVDQAVPLYVKGDSHRLQQVLNNLLNNAIKFTQEGSVNLLITLENETEDKFDVIFSVMDTGIGIPKEKMEDIFQPFKQAEADTTRKYGGTGLGLAIIKNIVEQQGGRIEVESLEGKGSTFKAYLPFERALLVDEDETLEEQLGSLRGTKVLYIEDVAVNQLLLEGFCNLWNVELDVVSSGVEALEQVRKRRYDLILMDIQMPHMDGYEATRRIRTIQGDYFNKVPIVALSAEVSEDIKTKIYKSGMNGYLTKPIVPSELHSTIQRYVPDLVINTFEETETISLPKKEDFEIIDFKTLDKLFTKQQDEYIHFLDNILNDFSRNFREMRNGIREKDNKTFSDARHKMLSILKIMRTENVLAILDEIKGDFDAGLVNKDNESIDQLNSAYDSMIEGIYKKIEALKSNQ